MRHAGDAFWPQVDQRGPDECWQWMGYKNEQGYGRFQFRGKGVRTHRYAYEQLVRPVPAGLELDHLCRNRACVNPAHLEAVTHKENYMRGQHPHRLLSLAGVCKRGHSLELDGHYRNGKRMYCRRCHNERRRV